MAYQDGGHVRARTPGTVRSGGRIGIPGKAPVLVRRVVRDKRCTCAESVLRSKTSHSNMKRMICEQQLRAAGKAELLAVFVEAFTFAREVGAKLSLLLC